MGVFLRRQAPNEQGDKIALARWSARSTPSHARWSAPPIAQLAAKLAYVSGRQNAFAPSTLPAKRRRTSSPSTPCSLQRAKLASWTKSSARK